MRALLNTDIARKLGVVLLRPGTDLMPLFSHGRVLVEAVPEHLKSLPNGAVPPARQSLSEDAALFTFFTNEEVIRVAGGLSSLEHWLERGDACQWPHTDWHHQELTTLRHQPGAIRVCWHCDNQLRDQYTEQLAVIARKNVIDWIIQSARIALRFDDAHELTLPELCWWAFCNELTTALPESMARRALRLPDEFPPIVSRESDLVPGPAATEIVQRKVAKAEPLINGNPATFTVCTQKESPVVKISLDPGSPESLMARPKRRRWEKPAFLRWVKAQPCACCSLPADDPHHLIGYGQGGMGTKAHDAFTIPLCRKHHDELHKDRRAFENRYGTQPELIIKLLDRAFALGVLA